MKKNLFLILLAATFIFGGNYSFSQGSQTTIPCPSGTVSTTLPSNGFSGDDPTTATGSCGQCCYAGSDLDGDGDQDVTFSVENSKWFKFCNSGASTLTQTFTVDETANNCNLQGAIFVGSSASPNNASDALDVDCGNTQFDEYGSNVSGGADGFAFSNISIAPGQCAYIMVDGYAGATCNDGFTISTSCTVCTAPTSITESADINICEGTSTGLTATAVGGIVSGSVHYSWTPTTGLSCGTCQSPTASPTGTTTYTVRACNDGAGVTCCTTDQVVVTVTPTFTANAGPDVTSCAPSTVSIGGSPTGPAGSTYSWVETGANANIAISGSSTVANPTVAISAGATGSATYTVTVTNGPCVRTDAVTVTVGTLAVSAGPDVSVCAGQTVNIGGSPTAPAGATYAWVVSGTNDADLAISGSSAIANPTITTVSGGSGSETYQVTATLSGCSNTDLVTVTIDPIPTTPTATASPATVCAGVSSTLTAAGGAGSGTYTWWSAATGGTQLGSGNTFAVSPTGTTTYYIQSADATTLCPSLRGSVTVTVNATPVANAGTDVERCQGTAINLAGSITNPGACGPPSQTWSIVSGTGTFSNANSLTSTFTPTSSGTITLRLTPCSPGGCTPVADDVVLTINPSPTVTASATDPDICPNQITDLNALVTGGTPAPPTVVTNTFSSAAGPFNIPENNANGVVIPISVTGVSNATLGVTDISGVTVNVDHSRIGHVEVWLCPPGVATTSPYTGCIRMFDNSGGNSDDLTNTVFSDAGTTDIASGTAPYTGTFNLAGTNVLTSLDGSATNGTWNVVVLDNNGASGTTGTAGQMSIDFATSTPAANPYTYSWTNATGISPTNAESTTLSASSFTAPTTINKTITVTDSKGCTDSEIVSVTLHAPPTATITSGTTDLCPASAGLGLTSANVAINFTGAASWTYTPVRDGVNGTPVTTASDPTTYNITYAEVAALGDQTMVFTLTAFSDNYCPGTVVASHTLTAFCLLPINLVSFQGKRDNRVNLLEWITASETNNSHFIVEKSSNGHDFSTLEKVESKNGNSLVSQEYKLVDKSPFDDQTYYKLGQVDFNGTYHYLSTIMIDNQETKQITIAPNPVVDYLFIKYNNEKEEQHEITISDIFGKIIFEEKLNVHEGMNDTLLNFSNYSDGIYYISIISSDRQETIKIIKTSN